MCLVSFVLLAVGLESLCPSHCVAGDVSHQNRILPVGHGGEHYLTSRSDVVTVH
jgi:hypothetical protein